jgi:DNA polymerase mu
MDHFAKYLGIFRHPKIHSYRYLRLDLISVPYAQWPFAILGWTGTQQFERFLRTYSDKELGYHLCSHGIWTKKSEQHNFVENLLVPVETHQQPLPKTEQEIFKILQLPYIPPNLRWA